MPQDPPASPPSSKLMRLYLLLFVFLIVPIALSYGLAPASVASRSPRYRRVRARTRSMCSAR